MRKTFQFRIYPTKNQEVALNRTLSTCRHLYNDSLGERKRQSELNELERTFDVSPWGKLEWLNYYDQANSLSGSKTDFQKDVFSQVLQNVLKRVERSFKNFFMASDIHGFREENDTIASHIRKRVLILKMGNLIFQKRNSGLRTETSRESSSQKYIEQSGIKERILLIRQAERLLMNTTVLCLRIYRCRILSRTIILLNPYQMQDGHS